MSDIVNLYANLAGYYDQLCAEVDYAQQCEFANRAFSCFASSGGRDYLDLACGTGPHLQCMEGLGFSLVGLDNSARMLQLASLKVPSARLLLSDMAALDETGAFDLVTCFLYSIHYSYPPEKLRETLRRVWRALKPGGIFVFNAVDAAGACQAHPVTTQLAEGESRLTFESGWHYRGRGDVLDLRLAITRHGPDGVQRWEDHHCMSALSFRELAGMLETSGFESTLLEHDYTSMRDWDGKSFNVIVVACKPIVDNP